VAALGWNLAITHNNALSNTANAFTTEGAGLKTSTAQGSSLNAPEFEKILVSEFKKTDSWIVSYPDATSVHLQTQVSPQYNGIIAGLAVWWNRVNLLIDEGLWVLLGGSLLYGVFGLARRYSDSFSADLVGLAVAGLLIGGLSRFSGTLGELYSPERAAIVTAILLAVPVTMFLDDLVTILEKRGTRIAGFSLALGTAGVGVFALWATGLGAILFGGYPPGSLTSQGLNAQQFTVSDPEMTTALWLRTHTGYQDIVQTDLFGQLVMLSAPGKYQLVPEIVPPDVDVESYIYLSTANLYDEQSQAETSDESYFTQYRSTIPFFNKNFYVVYSTGSTRVYH
jgi:uncharacterized membrane protein